MGSMHIVDFYLGFVPMSVMTADDHRVAHLLRYLGAATGPVTTSTSRSSISSGAFLWGPVARGLDKLGVTANMVTLSSLGLSVITMVLLATGHFMAAFWMMIIAVSCEHG